MVESFGFKTLWLAARYLPALFIRWRFPSARLASLVYVDLRPRHDPVVIELHENGSAHLYLQVINLCPSKIELDRAYFSLICGGAEIKFIELSKRTFDIGEIAEIFLRAQIPSDTAVCIARSPENSVSLHGHIEFNSALRQFPKVVGSLSGVRPRLVNLEYRQRLTAGTP